MARWLLPISMFYGKLGAMSKSTYLDTEEVQKGITAITEYEQEITDARKVLAEAYTDAEKQLAEGTVSGKPAPLTQPALKALHAALDRLDTKFEKMVRNCDEVVSALKEAKKAQEQNVSDTQGAIKKSDVASGH